MSSIEFASAQFSGGDANFERANFSGFAIFEEAKFSGGDANFNGAQFSNNVIFEKAEIKKYALFNGVNFIKSCDALCLNRTECDKICIKWDSIKDGKLMFNDEAYLNLIKNYKNLGWFEDYNECYYYYMKERNCDGCFRWVVSRVFYVTYGYGAKPEYPLIWSIAIILIFGFIWWGTEPSLKSGKYVSTLKDAFRFSFMVFLSSTKLSVDPPDLEIREESWDKSIFLAERLIGSLLFFFFLFAASTSLLIKIV